MAQPNFQFEKRQKELARKKKQDEKKQRKLAEKAAREQPDQTGNEASATSSAEGPALLPDSD